MTLNFLSIFHFDDRDRGEIEFTGSVLFTHSDEIGDPSRENFGQRVHTIQRQPERPQPV